MRNTSAQPLHNCNAGLLVNELHSDEKMGCAGKVENNEKSKWRHDDSPVQALAPVHPRTLEKMKVLANSKCDGASVGHNNER